MAPSRLPLRLIRWALAVVVMSATMLAIAGRLDLVMLNAYLAMTAIVALVAALGADPDLIRERLRPHQKGEDPARLITIRILTLLMFVTALLDIGRLHRSDSVPRAVQIAALVATALGLLVAVWALSVNRFFVPVIRIQSERGHRLVDRGPYGRVRHPGYAGVVIAIPASALALGSWWALLPGLLVATLFVRRAAHEDRFLREHLDGYVEYAGRVRYRLWPGIW